MFGKKKESALSRYGVHIELKINNSVVRQFCGRENAVKLFTDDHPGIKKTSRLDTYDGVIQKAEATCISHSPEMWFHHGCSTFATSSNMRIDIDHNLDELEFKIVDQWFAIETSDSKVCIFFAPIKHMLEIMNNGHLGFVGIDGVESEVDMPSDFPWLEGIHLRIDGGLINKEQNGIAAVYTNEAVQMRVNTIYEGGEHPFIRG